MMTKVCFFINTLDNSGGTERVTTVLAKEFVRKGYEVHIISWYGSNVSFYTLDPKIQTHYIFENKVGNIYKDYFKSLKIYRQLLSQIAPEYLIDVCVALSLLSIPATVGKNIKIISWEHFNTGVSWNAYTAKISRLLAAKCAHKVVTLTSGDKENYETFFHAKNVEFIPNPVTLNPKGRANLDEKNVLAIGRFTEQKGFDLLLPIWKKVSLEVHGWKLRIIGDGELKRNILRLAEDLELGDTVEFIEPTKEISKYYLSSSIYVMTSRFEGLPLVLLEAKAFGLPVVSYDCDTGPRDIVIHKQDGVLVPFLNSQEFETALLDLMRNPDLRNRYGSSALQDISRFNIHSIIESWIQILR